MDVSLLCAAGFLTAILAHFYLMPPPHLKAPQRTLLLSHFTYLTMQSNCICFAFHMMCVLVPDSVWVVRLHPLAFTLGFMLSPLYYGLDHFQRAKAAADREWIGKGYRWIPLGNHLEHGMALPLALLDALVSVRATPDAADIVIFCGGYGTAYFVFVILLNKRLSGWWVYPVFEDLEHRFGAIGPFVLGLGVPVLQVAIGFVDRALS